MEDELRSMAPPVLGGGTCFYTEDDIRRCYGKRGKCADATIDFGPEFVTCEIVSGQLTTNTRVDADVAAFRADMKKLVYKKLHQLHDTAEKLVAAPERLTGTGQSREIQPVVIGTGGLPVNPVTANLGRIRPRQRSVWRLTYSTCCADRPRRGRNVGGVGRDGSCADGPHSRLAGIGDWQAVVAQLATRTVRRGRTAVPECCVAGARFEDNFVDMAQRLGIAMADEEPDRIAPHDAG